MVTTITLLSSANIRGNPNVATVTSLVTQMMTVEPKMVGDPKRGGKLNRHRSLLQVLLLLMMKWMSICYRHVTSKKTSKS